MQRIIVFLGPSLERKAAETILPAEYRPPAKRGTSSGLCRTGLRLSA